VLTGKGLAAFRGERLVFRDLDFSVPAGGAILLVGPNGSGKSTLLRVLAGLGRLAAGRLLWNDEDLAEQAELVAYVGHQDAVKPGLTVAENLSFYARLSVPSWSGVTRPSLPNCAESIGSAPAKTAIGLAALALTDLADVPARMLSAGQKRRLALSRLALTGAPLWLLDEPTLGLDTAAIERFGVLLRDHRARGGIVVAATHVPLPMADVAELRLG